MIIKKQAFAALVIAAFIGSSFAQSGKYLIPEDRTMRDGFGRIITERSDSSNKAYYYTLTGDTLEVECSHTVEFIGGKDSLRSYLNAHYYGYVGPDAIELNQLAYFTVLLNDDLSVIETRILNPANPTNAYAIKPPLDSVFIAALNASSGHWKKIDPNDSLPKYHMTAVSYRIF